MLPSSNSVCLPLSRSLEDAVAWRGQPKRHGCPRTLPGVPLCPGPAHTACDAGAEETGSGSRHPTATAGRGCHPSLQLGSRRGWEVRPQAHRTGHPHGAAGAAGCPQGQPCSGLWPCLGTVHHVALLGSDERRRAETRARKSPTSLHALRDSLPAQRLGMSPKAKSEGTGPKMSQGLPLLNPDVFPGFDGTWKEPEPSSVTSHFSN